MLRLTIALALVFACSSNPGDDPAKGGSNAPVCGDGVCNATEIHSCPADCGMGGSGSAATCGDGICQSSENASTCPADCTVAMCGNGVCENGENSSNCPEDCGSDPGPFDCTSSTTQDNCGFCFEDDYFEGLGSCDADEDAFPGTAADCAMCVANGNFGTACVSECSSGETDACAQCENLLGECNDGFCEIQDGENAMNCPADCDVLVCGDGICDVSSGETSTTCSADCVLNATFNNFDCSNSDNQDNCQDCFFDDSDMLDECTTDGDVVGGTADDCAKCASIGAFGNDCVTSCGAVETEACATCVADDF